MKLDTPITAMLQTRRGTRHRRLPFVRFFVVMAMLIAAVASWQWAGPFPAAQAAFSGNNGQIALTSDRDGAGERNLTVVG